MLSAGTLSLASAKKAGKAQHAFRVSLLTELLLEGGQLAHPATPCTFYNSKQKWEAFVMDFSIT